MAHENLNLQVVPAPRGGDIDFGNDPSAYRGATRITTRIGADGQIEIDTAGGPGFNAGVSRVDTTQPDAWRQTGLNSFGSPVQKIGLATTVEIDGMRSDVKSFIAARMLEQLPDGSFARPTSPHLQDAPGTTQGTPRTSSSIPEAVEVKMAAAVQHVHPQIVEGAMLTAVNSAVHGDFSVASLDVVAKQLAGTGQMDLGAAQEHVSTSMPFSRRTCDGP